MRSTQANIPRPGFPAGPGFFCRHSGARAVQPQLPPTRPGTSAGSLTTSCLRTPKCPKSHGKQGNSLRNGAPDFPAENQAAATLVAHCAIVNMQNKLACKKSTYDDLCVGSVSAVLVFVTLMNIAADH
ncbi:MAG: hypothetical protein QM754_16870 [Tepidisphaeraceae bacterium]